MTQDQARKILTDQLTWRAGQYGKRYSAIAEELNNMRMDGELGCSRFPEPLRTAVKLCLKDRDVFREN